MTLHATLLNLYAPNFDNPGFSAVSVDKYRDNHCIAGGDFNCILDTFMDRSSSRPINPLDSTVVLNNLMKSLNLVDIWRIQHPTEKEYSFFSRVYFLIDSRLAPAVSSSKYHNSLFSDHSPIVTIGINVGWKKTYYNWQFNPNLLN